MAFIVKIVIPDLFSNINLPCPSCVASRKAAELLKTSYEARDPKVVVNSLIGTLVGLFTNDVHPPFIWRVSQKVCQSRVMGRGYGPIF